MTTQEILDFYKALLILQYSSLPNALATVEAYISALIQNQVVSQFRDAWGIDTAIGKQLDILGAYRGVPRTVFGVSAGLYWSLPSITDPNIGTYVGWSSIYDVSPPTGRWLQIPDISRAAYSLTDTQMRRLIHLKAQLDSWDGSLAELDNILYASIGSYVSVIDNENMTIVYQHQLADPDTDKLFEIAVLAQALPHPAGVSFSVTEV